jgi:preprotein translocase subunit SecG
MSGSGLFMESLVIIVHVLAAIGITGLVLIQQGKGADMGASFGSGASQTIFGSVGSGNALTKSTAWLATMFFVTSLVLALYAKQQAGQGLQNESLILNPEQVNLNNAVQQQDIPVLAAEQSVSDIPQAAAEFDAAGDIPDAVVDEQLDGGAAIDAEAVQPAVENQ